MPTKFTPTPLASLKRGQEVWTPTTHGTQVNDIVLAVETSSTSYRWNVSAYFGTGSGASRHISTGDPAKRVVVVERV